MRAIARNYIRWRQDGCNGGRRLRFGTGFLRVLVKDGRPIPAGHTEPIRPADGMVNALPNNGRAVLRWYLPPPPALLGNMRGLCCLALATYSTL